MEFVSGSMRVEATANGWEFRFDEADRARSLAAARLCAENPHPGLLQVVHVSDVVSTETPAQAPLAHAIAARGALDVGEALVAFSTYCEAVAHLSRLGHVPLIHVSTLLWGANVAPKVVGFGVSTDEPTAVRALAAAFYEAVRGVDPPARPRDEPWVGPRPELVELIFSALEGTGPATAREFGDALRALGRGDTAVPKGSGPATAVKDFDTVGGYALTRRLASGGMGDVYLARHVRLERDVAVKLIRPEWANDPELVRRFFGEARVVNRINHPHIVEVLDYIEEPGRVAMVMELLHGHDLAALAKAQGPLPMSRCLALMEQVCEALAAAHRLDVVHRDIKPENVFVTERAGKDFVKVLDFGIAKEATSGRAATQVGVVMGTLDYMAPEQALGQAVDARADVYAVGVVLKELLTHTSPRVSSGTPLRLSALGETIPLHIVKLIEACTAMEPSRRPVDASAVLEVLRQVPKRRRGTFVAVGAGAAASVVLAVFLERSVPEAPFPAAAPSPVEVGAPVTVTVPVEPPVIPAKTVRDPARELEARFRRVNAAFEKLAQNGGVLSVLEQTAWKNVVAAHEGGRTAELPALLGDAEAVLRARPNR